MKNALLFLWCMACAAFAVLVLGHNSETIDTETK